jgi:hypothetical protein
MITLRIKLSEIIDCPGGERECYGPYSGEWFFRTKIKHYYLKIKPNCPSVKFEIDLTGTYGIHIGFVRSLALDIKEMLDFMHGDNYRLSHHIVFVFDDDERELLDHIREIYGDRF